MASVKKARLVFQLPNIGSWFENIAVRPKGTILATRADVPELWEIDPATGEAAAIATFPAPVTGVTGITELAPDVWAIGAGQYSLTTGTVPGTFSVWTLDLSTAAGPGPHTPKLVVPIPEAGLINGMTTFDAARGIVLAADSEFFALYAVDIAAGSYTRALEGEALASPEGAPLKLGINGVRLWEGQLFFTNSMQQTMYRVPVAPIGTAGGFKTTGPPEAVAAGFSCDDFTFDADGTAYVTTHAENTVVRVAPGSKESVRVAGSPDSLEVAGSTACMFGRGDADKKVLYVVTSGALLIPVKGELREPAKVIAIDLD